MSASPNPAASGTSPRIRLASGSKYRHSAGHTAIKDGIKSGAKLIPVVDATTDRKPPWIRARLPGGARYKHVEQIVRTNRLATVCEESHCPNIGECWTHGTATLMLLGDVCTRACRFCAVDTGNPRGWLDNDEPAAAANAVKLMGLQYVVLTSVDRDDLPLGGADHYAACIRAIQEANATTTIEALTPDFQGDATAIERVVETGLDVFAHNVETVERLTPSIRDPRATYKQSLQTLRTAKRVGADLSKSGLMLGLGETDDELRRAMCDLLEHDVDLLTLGQYLRPTNNHHPVVRWVTPGEFEEYREWALELGFREVSSGPLVRSSYRADALVKNMLEVRNAH